MTNRKELYAKVKELHIEDVIKTKYGKNYTQVSNESLLQEITKFENAVKKEPKKSSKKSTKSTKDVVIEDLNKQIPFEIPKNIYESDNALHVAKTAILMLDILMDILQSKHIITEGEVETFGIKHMKDTGLIPNE